jgi:predicted DNA-binding WGR domain protein
MAEVNVIELRFEDYANNNHKFYRAYTWNGGGLTQWGRIGTKGQFKLLTETLARRKVTEKHNEGYEITTQWLKFTVDGHVMAQVINGDYRELEIAAKQAIGNRVAPPQAKPAKSEEEVEQEFADQLLAMAGKYAKPEKAPASQPEPEEPKADPTSIEGRLGAALAAARDAS